MILDKELIFSDKQALTAAAASTNIVDQGAAGDAYEALWLVVNITTAVTGKVGLKLQTCAASAFSSNVKDLLEVGYLDAPAVGNVIKTRIPLGSLRYLRVSYTAPDSGGVSAGTVSAFLVRDTDVDNA